MNVTRRAVLAEDAAVASSWWRRGIGLMGARALDPGGGLVIVPCTSIHTWFMRFPIDAVFVAADGRVVRLGHTIRPWRVGPVALSARFVVELPAGTLKRTGTVAGDRVVTEPVAPS